MQKTMDFPALEPEIDQAQAMLLFNKLGKDQAKAAEQLKRSQVRYLVDMYYQVQKLRIMSAAQLKACEEAGEPNLMLEWIAETNRLIEASLKRGLDRFGKQFKVGQWLQSQVGIGPVITAGLMAEFDIRIANHAGRFHSFAGMDPTKKWEKKTKRPWNARLKTLCIYKAGESFVKTQNNPKAFYGKLFREYRDKLEVQNEAGQFSDAAAAMLLEKNIGKTTDAYAAYIAGKLPKAHLHARARRWVVKLFISHLHYVMYDDFHGKPPALPWVFERAENALDHRHFIAPPNWPSEEFTGRPIADLYAGSPEPNRIKIIDEQDVLDS